MGKVIRVIFAGNIGAGKSVLVNAAASDEYRGLFQEILEEVPRRIAQEEIVDRNLLQKFAEDQQEYALPFQTSFLYSSARQEREVASLDRALIFRERGIHVHRWVHGEAQIRLGNLQGARSSLYHSKYEDLSRGTAPDDMYVYLKASAPTLQERIRLRHRPGEEWLLQNTTYLDLINRLYDDFFRRVAPPVVEVDAERIRLGPAGLDQGYLRETLRQVAEGIKTCPNYQKEGRE